jgi:hypothetical protein
MNETNAVPLERASQLLFNATKNFLGNGIVGVSEGPGRLSVWLRSEEDRRLLRGVVTEGNMYFGWPVTIRVIGKITIGGEE